MDSFDNVKFECLFFKIWIGSYLVNGNRKEHKFEIVKKNNNISNILIFDSLIVYDIEFFKSEINCYFELINF